ncbi:MAG: type II toxin-antitoxin system RelE/ParE family toxin [Lachnospiraceae bacterium]|nr:type II toxin-antitoxin system RelE/ParE family toxin [Lachnospiraceae bacterium]
MAYKLIITDHADELIDSRIYYIINKLKNPPAAQHLLDGIDEIYTRLEDNPDQFPDSMDSFLRSRGFKEALIHDMNYKLVFRVEGRSVYIEGLFHDLENHASKLHE